MQGRQITPGFGAWLSGACLLALTGSAAPRPTLTAEAFIWQFQWTASVGEAAATNADLFAAWHVLTAELPQDGPPILTNPDWSFLTRAGHRAIPVVRIEGRITAARLPGAVQAILAIQASLPPDAAHAIEIDHDAATSQLDAYAAFLRALRARLPRETTLSATALPAWLEAPGFEGVADAVDLLVLQVHAIDDPRLGLFRPARALAAIRALALRTATPFQVALPAYGVRVSEGGGRLAVAAEALVPDGRAGAEIAADPRAVASVLAALRRDPPPGLRGIVWFRLPVAGDTRAWSQATLRHVVEGQVLERRLSITSRAGQVPGASDIVLRNDGTDDAALPPRIVLPAGCLAADGLGRYGIDGGALALRGQGGLLHAQAWLLAGWMRCDGEGLHAQD